MSNYPEKIIKRKEKKIDDLTVKFEVVTFEDTSPGTHYCASKINQIDIESEIDKYNKNIEKLTNHSDGLDYIFSIFSAILCGAIDAFWVGEFSFEEANKWGTDKVEKFVQYVAKKQSGENKNLVDSIKYLESYWPSPSDSLSTIFGGSRNHHLNDFAHHPTFVGLFFSLFTQFTGKACGLDISGKISIKKVKEEILIGETIPEKIFLGTIAWFFHLVSDVAGSSSSLEKGLRSTGIPGPIVSLIKEATAIPLLRDNKGIKKINSWVLQLWKKRVNFQTELGSCKELGRQSIPIILNEFLVRSFYFIRRFISVAKQNSACSFSDIKKLNWEEILPIGSRTIARMITVSSAAFEIIDGIDAFIKRSFLRVNFVGIGRFAIAVYNDLKMGIKLRKTKKKLQQCQAKSFYEHKDSYHEIEG